MLYFKGHPVEETGYCKCRNIQQVTSEMEALGYWDICCKCGKPLEDGFHYFNHFDGEEHDDIDLY